jgi:hypothetical protein
MLKDLSKYPLIYTCIAVAILISFVFITIGPSFLFSTSEPPTQNIANYQAKEIGATNSAKESGWSDPVAMSTLFVAFATLVLVGIVGWQVKLARDDFISTHRPILAVRHVAFVDLVNSDIPEIDFSVANVGGSDANIVEINGTMWFGSSPLPGIPRYNARYTQRSSHIIKAGESIPFRFTSGEFSVDAFNNSVERGAHFCFFGYVLFADKRGVERRIGFGRDYTRSTGCFNIMDNADYEYGA